MHSLLNPKMIAISDAFLNLFYFYTGQSPDSGGSSPLEPSWETISSAVLRKSTADPAKWLRFFDQIIEHPDIPDECAAPVFDGVVAHLHIRSGRIQPPGGGRLPPSVPSKDRLARFILECLEGPNRLLENGQRVADAVLALTDTAAALENPALLVSCLVRLSAHPDPVPVCRNTTEPRNTLHRELFEAARCSVRGKAAESAAGLAARLRERLQSRDPLLATLLIRFATDPHPGVRAAVLHQLGRLACHDNATAWKLYRSALQSFQEDLWPHGETFLLMQYDAHRASVLSAYRRKPPSVCADGRVWGETLTKACLEGSVPSEWWIRDLESVALEDAWTAAFDLLDAHLENARYRNACKKGLLMLASRPMSMPCLLGRLPSFLSSRTTDFIDITVEIAYRFIMNFNGSNRPYDLGWLYRWIAELSRKAPAMAVQIRGDLLAAISRSERSRRIWQAKTYAGCLLKRPESDPEQREQRR